MLHLVGVLADPDGRLAVLQSKLLQLLLPSSVALGLGLTLVAEIYSPGLNVSLLGCSLTVLPLAVWALLQSSRRAGLWMLALGYVALGLCVPRWLGATALVSLLPVTVGLSSLLLGLWQGAAVALLTSLAILAEGKTFGIIEVPARVILLAAIWGVQAFAWASVGYAIEAVEEATASYQTMRSLLEEARKQRSELKQIQADLVLANNELGRISERLEAMRQVAEEARRAKEEFAANVSHELRTPLNMIVGSRACLQTRYDGSRGPGHACKWLDSVFTRRVCPGFAPFCQLSLCESWLCKHALAR